MSELGRAADLLRRMLDGGAWHGPSLREALDGVTATEAVRRPIDGAHNIHELVHHIGAWNDEVASRLGGRSPRDPEVGDFPAPASHLDEEAWSALRRQVATQGQRLVAAIRAFDEGRLDDRVGTELVATSTTSYHTTIHGAIEHTAYHVGQLVLVRRALRGSASQ